VKTSVSFVLKLSVSLVKRFSRPLARTGNGRRRRFSECANLPLRWRSPLMNETSKSNGHSLVAAPRVLVVEDETDVALLIAYNLEAEGYFVESVARGDEAELRLAESPPDLVILDWMLPGVSGIEVCRRLRSSEQTRSVPVIMVTARHQESDRVRDLAVGADDYVVKPFSVIELVSRVRALLRRSRAEGVAGRVSFCL
jgi:two-component system, OmpR family, phosphate regulon response regulator PhoB